MRVEIADERPLASGEPDLSQATIRRTRYGFIFGAAMGARYLAAYDSNPARGPLWAGWLALRTIGSSLIPGGGRFARWLFALTPAAVTIDGQPQSEQTFRNVVCATVPDVGLGDILPDPANIPPGCRFHPRCPIAEPRCSVETPPLKPRPAGGVECLLVP
jgi:oligopeptide/dipeptide ABC transporter ATP-binding protein